MKPFGEAMNRCVERLLANPRLDRHTIEAEYTDDERDAAVSRRIAERAAAERAQEHRKRAIVLRDDGGFPAVAVGSALAPWPAQTTAMEHTRSFLQTRSTALVLAGGVGAGKTTAAAWAALEAGGSAPAFIRASELEARGRYDKALRAWLSKRSMIVLDDLGAEVLDGKGVFRSFFDELVDHAYSNRRLLIITTNLRPRRKSPDEQEQFVERYGDRVASRLAQVGRWADCGARDLRRDQLALATGGQEP